MSREKVVELRPEQRAQLKNIREEFFPQIKEIRSQLHKERKVLGRLLMEEKTDSVTIGKQVEQIESLQTDIERKVIRQLLKEKSVLDPEQRQNYLRMIMKRIHAPLPLGPLPEEEGMQQKHNQ